ncbi:I78 family peptidase inhibitor [Sphingomonas sp. C3-2]|uniref:I78 family peptidase inhibitor n=1 Tax=Sphingomonas sp. C3-2 TaxID=3062169 RepID=UPI00294B4FAF|nr:I78 family peptidase inhibitor [Sphingomonas sp. C3-2]WOK36906.1 I78 family peptidase inhibitor [Sphingomonas sp. C3-2]
MKTLTFAAAPLLLAACATTPGSEPASPSAPAQMCKNEAVQQFKGQAVSAELGAAALKASGAQTLRWGPPRSAMTMDYRADRLTISYDDDLKVTMIGCG